MDGKVTPRKAVTLPRVFPISRSKERVVIAESRGTRRQIVVEKINLEQVEAGKMNLIPSVSSVKKKGHYANRCPKKRAPAEEAVNGLFVCSDFCLEAEAEGETSDDFSTFFRVKTQLRRIIATGDPINISVSLPVEDDEHSTLPMPKLIRQIEYPKNEEEESTCSDQENTFFRSELTSPSELNDDSNRRSECSPHLVFRELSLDRSPYYGYNEYSLENEEKYENNFEEIKPQELCLVVQIGKKITDP
jgi:hypothetical protein